MKLAIKIDVDTFRGTREGVPRLVDLLKKHGAGATFLFSLGPDHTGRALRRDAPHAAGIWSFEDLSARRQLKADLTPREREIAALLIEGLTSKQIGKRLTISPRTVDVYRARLMKKYGAATTPDLVHKLLSA